MGRANHRGPQTSVRRIFEPQSATPLSSEQPPFLSLLAMPRLPFRQRVPPPPCRQPSAIHLLRLPPRRPLRACRLNPSIRAVSCAVGQMPSSRAASRFASQVPSIRAASRSVGQMPSSRAASRFASQVPSIRAASRFASQVPSMLFSMLQPASRSQLGQRRFGLLKKAAILRLGCRSIFCDLGLCGGVSENWRK